MILPDGGKSIINFYQYCRVDTRNAGGEVDSICRAQGPTKEMKSIIGGLYGHAGFVDKPVQFFG
jgi:hypothetical protein